MFKETPNIKLGKGEAFVLVIGPAYTKAGFREDGDERPFGYLMDLGVTVEGSNAVRYAKTFSSIASAEKFLIKHVRHLWSLKTNRKFDAVFLSWHAHYRDEFTKIQGSICNRVRLVVVRKEKISHRVFKFTETKNVPFF